MTKKIIFDASVLVSGNTNGNLHKTGLYRVSYEVLKGLIKLKDIEIYLFDIFYRERELIKYVQKEFPQCKIIRIHSLWYKLTIFPLGNLIDFLRKIQLLNNTKILSVIAGVLKNCILMINKVARKIDRFLFLEKNLNTSFNQCILYYSTYFPVPVQILNNSKIKKVYTVHDMIPIIHPEYFSSPFNSKLVKEVINNIKKNDYVICVSESTKNDLLYLRPEIDPDQVFVAPLAAADCFHHVTEQESLKLIRSRYKIPMDKKYFLSVCTFEPRKNLKTLISAYSILLIGKKTEDFVLVLTGAPYWERDFLLDDIALLNSKYDNRIILTGFIPDNDLAVLYSGAYAFVYPSFYEGFGLPPLEAMQCGVPVISSRTSSLPEVIGDCGILIDPENPAELAEAITKLNENENLRDILSKKSILRAANFSWTNTTAIIKNVFDLAIAIK